MTKLIDDAPNAASVASAHPSKRKFAPRRLKFQTQKSKDESGEDARRESVPRPGAAALKWKADVARLGQAWPELTADDLSKLENRETTLLSLLQSRYGISRAEADRKVAEFAADRQSATLWAGERESRSLGPHQLAPMRPPVVTSQVDPEQLD